LDLNNPCRITDDKRTIELPPLPPENLGHAEFRRRFGVKLAYMAGSMAKGIASEELVIAMGQAGLLASFGAAGVAPDRLRSAIRRITTALPQGPYAFNLIHSPANPETEAATVQAYLDANIRIIEASAFMKLEPALVWYRAAGIVADGTGQPIAQNRIIAKLSRREVAEPFMRPPPAAILQELVAQGRLTARQAEWAARFPVADAITVEADSGGHTDRQPLVTLLPALLVLRDAMQSQYDYAEPLLLGAGGGLGTPASITAAFAMGADYVVTGSINQACVEAGTSERVKALLAEVAPTDVAMAPAADMFELGVQVQVAKRGTLFPMRAQRLYELYRSYDSLEALPTAERGRLEQQFGKTLEQVWAETQTYLAATQPKLLQEGQQSPKKRMALVFRWYLGQSSQWANSGEASRAMDYQIWCGPAMGAFNAWSAGSPLAQPAHRNVVNIAQTLMQGAAYLTRVHMLRVAGATIHPSWASFSPGDLREPTPQPLPAASFRPNARAIAVFLRQQIAEQTDIPQDQIDSQRPFENFGLDSVKSMVILNRLETWLGEKLSPTLVWNHPTIEQLAKRLAQGDCKA
jgi:PfaD family protein